MIATVDIAEIGPREVLRSLRRRPQPGEVPGLRWADTALVLPLARFRPPGLRRAALLAFWDDEDAAGEFRASHPVGRRFAAGFHASLRPLRAFGAWPGLPADLPATRAVPHEGPVMVLTLGWLRLSQTVRFLRTSRPAEQAALTADGFIWGTAAARPPFVSTVTAWESSQAAAAYAYARQRPQHSDAVAEQQRKDFHERSAFVRFEPLEVQGDLGGINPVSAEMIAT